VLGKQGGQQRPGRGHNAPHRPGKDLAPHQISPPRRGASSCSTAGFMHLSGARRDPRGSSPIPGFPVAHGDHLVASWVVRVSRGAWVPATHSHDTEVWGLRQRSWDVPWTSPIQSEKFGAGQRAHAQVWCRAGCQLPGLHAGLMYAESHPCRHAQPFGRDCGANGRSWPEVLTSRSRKSSSILTIEKLNLCPLQSFSCILKLFERHFCFE